MLGLASDVLKTTGKAVQSAFFDRIRTYVNYVKNCDKNLLLLLEELEELQVEKGDFDDQVLGGKEKSEKLTGKAAHWLAQVRDLTKDEKMKKIMNKDMEIAKLMLRLVKDDLKKLAEEDGEMCDLVLKVMKDVTKKKNNAGDGQVSDAEEKDKEVCQVLEKLIAETMGDFKTLMQNEMSMAVAALHLLENHMENLERLMEKDKDVALIIAEAREMRLEEESLSDDNHNNVLARENALREKVTNLLKPVREVILNKEFLKALPENVRLGMDVLGIVMGNGWELKDELTGADNSASHIDCCCCVISLCCFSDRHDMSVAAEAMLGKITDIRADIPKNGCVTRPIRRGEMEGVPTYSVGLNSRKRLLRKITKALASDDVNALGVFGMGGSGKTTLAKEVANSKANGIFKIVVMVEISESPNIEYIQDQIGNGLGLEDMHNVHGISEKAKSIYNRLEQREDDNNSIKTLIILDNIWTKIDVGQIGIHREYCKILVTSRVKNVCKEMDVQSDNIFEVGLLNNDEAKVLFKFQVQKDILTGEHKSIVDRLLEKCGGLPLSIVATANSLKGKELPLWRQFAEELEKPISCQTSGARHETFSILRTSYEVMASEEKKKFFLLACLSRVGSSISIDNLMRYGIGLGLFQNVNKLSEAITQAHIWAEELVSSSMFLEGDSKEKVKIHDVVRQSTMSFASKSHLNKDGQTFLVDAIPRWIFEESFNRYTGISLLNQANYARLNGVKAHLLQILLLKGSTSKSSFLEPNFFQGMTNLKVLEVLYMDFRNGLPESMAKLKDLKTLHLVKCNLGDIKLIGKLKSLLVLSLRKSSLEELPVEIGKLYNLRLLDLSNCRCKQSRIPANMISELSLLEGLYLFRSSFTEWAVTGNTYNATGVTDGAAMDELNKLDFFNVLEVSILEPMYLPICDQFVENLDKFQIRVGGDYFETPPSQRLLAISQFDVNQELKKDNCLKALLKKADLLSLHRAAFKNSIVPELDEEGFKDLSHLELFGIQCISRICEGKAPTGLFCNLRHLRVSSLNNLEELLPVKPVPQKLTTLDIMDCDSLTYIFHKKWVNKESDIIELPCLKILNVSLVNSLRSLVKQSNIDENRHQSFFSGKVKLPSLEKLSFIDTQSIVKLWDKEFNIHSFHNLKELIIEGCKNMKTIGPPSIFLSLVQLESLSVKHNVMQNVISKESESQEIPKGIVTFPKLKFLWMESLENFECFYDGSYKLEFPRLETLDLSHLQSMTKFAGCGDSTTFFNEQVKLSSLVELKFKNMGKIAKLWGPESDIHSFQKLKVLEIDSCDEIETIGPPSLFQSLVQLESARVEKCQKIRHVISRESKSDEIPKKMITFPELKHLQLLYLKNLESFYNGSYKMKFSSLEKLILLGVKHMLQFGGYGNTTIFFHGQIEFPCLKELKLNKLRDVKLTSIVFKSLTCLEVRPKCDAKFLFSSSQNEGCLGTYSEFPKLEDLTIRRCFVERFVEDDGSMAMKIFCGQLSNLTLVSAVNMKFMSLHLFKSLRSICISCVPCEYIFSADGGFEELQSLEELKIEYCANLEVIIKGGDRDNAIVFPRLKILSLENLGRLSKFSSILDIPFHFLSLELLNIKSCSKLKTICSGAFVAPELREVEISVCHELQWLISGEPNQAVELPYLEEVIIFECDALKSFSTSPVKAPLLRRIHVEDCPEMEWFLLGTTNCGEDLVLTEMEYVRFYSCPNMKSFSPSVVRAPILYQVTVNGKFHRVTVTDDLNQFFSPSDDEDEDDV